MLFCDIISATVKKRERAQASWLTEEAEAVIYYHNIYIYKIILKLLQ